MPSWAIDLQQRLFRSSDRKKKICETRKKIRKLVSRTRGNRLQEYLVSESRGAPWGGIEEYYKHSLCIILTLTVMAFSGVTNAHGP